MKISLEGKNLKGRTSRHTLTISPEIACSLVLIIFAPLRLGQYLDYIENDSVKSFVLVSIALALLLFTFHCTV